jgi:hypothetical protein
MNSQDLTKHRWESRLILVITSDVDQNEFRNQIVEFSNHIKGLEERKLLVYQISPKAFRIGLDLKSKWQASETRYQEHTMTNNPFEIILIGLDGAVKLRQTEILTSEKLFSIIDAMPMRQSEIRNTD